MGLAGTDARGESTLVDLAERTFSDAIAVGANAFTDIDPDWADRSCAHFCVKPAGVEMLRPSVSVLLGGPGGNYDRREKYHTYAREKATRLERMMDSEELVDRHLTSWESRAPRLERWGGAVVVPIGGIEYIFSLSGLPEQGDEAFCLVLAERWQPSAELSQRIGAILERTENPYYPALRQALVGE